MDSLNHCSQFSSYTGNTDSCSGNIHSLTVKKEGVPPYTGIIVCDSCIPSYQELGQRETHQFTIVGDEIIGTIARSEEGQTPRKEQR